jgi:hypothetical protein
MPLVFLRGRGFVFVLKGETGLSGYEVYDPLFKIMLQRPKLFQD